MRAEPRTLPPVQDYIMPSDLPQNDVEAKLRKTQADAEVAGSDLEQQVSRLREDVAGVADALKALASERAEDARSQAYALRDEVRERGERYVRQAQDAASELEAQLSERIRAEPIKSVLIAAASGYLYARLFRR
ncbi:DUF883 family protein [Mangrovibrevibacter kandeliae]|uniref:DUF883 family protein n=2 Tax=Mangrovibrevibacter kandeliae TaxID=2968473 RepID=UPI002117FC37|nr:hypothetical protein [Aurantimonas sp. CSK15Z-1]MCQ8780954.1 hypothetical protein [Aurantimonas sp. CSK15Z-1]